MNSKILFSALTLGALLIGCGSAGPEHHDTFAERIDDGHQRLEESLAVGVLADKPVAAPDRAIDCSHDLRGLAQAVEVLDHAG